MERMILRHLSGSKANQVEEFDLAQIQECLLGRDPASTVAYDPARDDLVSRQHAKITPDPAEPGQWNIADLGSRNGTYLNKQRINGTARVSPGDVVQLGPSGPEFQFDLDPRPQTLGATRIVNMADLGRPAPPATRESDARTGVTVPATPVPLTSVAPDMSGSSGTDQPRATVGKATVERMITQTRNESRKTMMFGGMGAAAVVALGAFFLINQASKSKDELAGELTKTRTELTKTRDDIEQKDADRYLSVNEIAKKCTPSVVYIQVSWKLFDTSSGGIVYHKYLQTKSGPIPLYISRPDGSYEPVLTLDREGNEAIGGSGGGSGFVVSEDGFILTNRHVAAAWYAPMQLPAGLVFDPVRRKVIGTVKSGPSNWVPANAIKNSNRRSLTDRPLEGRNDYLEVTFPENKISIPAIGTPRVSPEHDVAMIKIDLPGGVPKLELNPDAKESEQGKPVTVVGYPFAGELAAGAAVVRDQSGGGEGKIMFIPEPTVTNGVIARVIHGGSNPLKYVNMAGDVYQHTAGTNPGNSGGPVLDGHGKVIGIHYAGIKMVQGANLAVPIKYGMDLMGTKAVSTSDQG